MKKLILYLAIVAINTYTQPIENQPLPKTPLHTIIENLPKDETLEPEISPENEDSEQKDPNNFEDIIECLTNPSSNCKNILFNPNDTSIYARTEYNLRAQPRLTIASVCSNDPEISKAIGRYHSLLTATKEFSGKSLYDQKFRRYIKQKERLMALCHGITHGIKSIYYNQWNDDKTLKKHYERLDFSVKKDFYNPYISQEYKPFLSDLKTIIEKKEKAEIFANFETYYTHTPRNSHDFFDVISCIITPQKNCNTILFSIDGDFSRSEYNVRCEAKKTIADYINDPANSTTIQDVKAKSIKNSKGYYWRRRKAERFKIIHDICQNIAASYCPSCDNEFQEKFYTELNRQGRKKMIDSILSEDILSEENNHKKSQ